MNYIITRRKNYFERIGDYNFCLLSDLSTLPKEIAVDTETEGLKFYKGEMFAIQIGTGTNNYLIDLETIDIYNVIPYLENKILVFQNAKFDLVWFAKYNFFPWKVRDTFLASKILNNGLVMKRHDFGTLMEEHLGIIYDKTEQQNISRTKLSTERAIQYCFNDVDRLLLLKDVLHQKIIDAGAVATYNLHCRWIRACAYMQFCGVPIDIERWNAKIESDKKELIIEENIVKDYIYDHLPKFRDNQIDMFNTERKILISPSSPKQMVKVFEAFGVDIDVEDKKTKKTKKSISESVISKSKHEFIEIWLKYQSIKHDVSTFGENFKPSIHNGRLYTNYKPIVDTARISAGGKNIDKTEVDDVNTLNIPANEKSRSPFRALEGNVLIDCDYAGQETRTGADLTLDPVSLDCVLNDKDLHSIFAKVLFPELADLTEQEIKDNHSDKRDISKSPRFCFQFGGTGYTLHMNEGIELERAMEIEKGYKELHPGIYSYGDKKLKQALKDGYLHYWGGFKLHLGFFEEFRKRHEKISNFSPDFWKHYGEGKKEYKKQKAAKEAGKVYVVKKTASLNLYETNVSDISKYYQDRSKYYKLCLNGETQSVAAHQTKAATNKVYEYIWKKKHFGKARIALVVHDEILLEVAKELALEYKVVLQEAMYNEGNKFIKHPDIKMECDAFIRDDWWKAKKAKKSDPEELEYV